MKKLMIAAAIVCAAAMSHAAAMSWATADPLLDPTGGEACGNCQITMYLWSIDSATYDTLSKSTDIGAAVWAKYGTALDTATKSALEEEGALKLKDTKTYVQGDTAYAAIILAYDPEQDGNITYYKGNIGEWKFDTASDKTMGNMDKFVGGGTSGTAVAWTAVPEPTSGLLLLLGVAGLALRRRRA